MFEKLENYLNEWVSEERKDSILDALTVMNTYSFPNAWSEISTMLEHATDESLDMIIDAVETIINTGLDRLLRMHTIMAIGTIPVKTRILEGIKALENYEDSQTVLAMTGDTSDPVQTLSDLLALVTPLGWTDFADVIQDVSPTLLVKLEELYISMEDQEQGFPTPSEVKQKRVNAFIEKYPTSIAAKAIVEDFRPIGVPANILINDYRLDLTLFEPKAPDQAAIEIAGIGLISDITETEYLKQTRDLLEQVFVDINFITKVDVSLSTVMTEVSRYG